MSWKNGAVFLAWFLICLRISVNAYGQIGHQNRIMLQDFNRDKFDRFMALQYKDLLTRPQPKVKCSGKSCTYSFTVRKSEDVDELCENDDDITNMLKGISEKLDALLLLKEEEIAREAVKAEQRKIPKDRKISAKDVYIDTTLGQLCHNVSSPKKRVLRDCQDVMDYVTTARGIYEIEPVNSRKFFVYCEDGWTVFQKREDGSVLFNRDWNDYVNGFGSLTTEFWLGNENLHRLTSQKNYKLQVDLGDWEGIHANAIYSSFRVDGASRHYAAHFGDFIAGSAGDSLLSLKPGGWLDGMEFSTWDSDRDRSERNCADIYSGGWWYNDCFMANLNGEYVFRNSRVSDSFVWRSWRGPTYSLKSSKLMVKPT